MIFFKIKLLALSFFLLMPLIASTEEAQLQFGHAPTEIINENPLSIEVVRLEETRLDPGGFTELTVDFNLAPEHYAYYDQFRLNVTGPSLIQVSEFHITPTTRFVDPISGTEKLGVEGYAQLTTLVQLPSNISSGQYNLKLDFTYQACTDHYCLFPIKVPLEVNLSVSGVGFTSENYFEKALGQGLFIAFIVAFIAGILTSFTPCIFPMIPITLAVLGTQDTGGSKRKGLLISSSYVFGIAITYAVLGVLAALTGAMFGSLLGHPVVVSIVALLFVVMGLSMFGLFELKVPDSVGQRLLGSRIEKGIPGAFLSGLVAGIVASPCVGPILIGILAYVAQTQNLFLGFFLLFTFALGLGQVFLVLGTFTSFIHKIPKSGPWMVTIKNLFGITMIAMALFFIYPVVEKTLFSGLIATALIALSIYFGAFKKLGTSPEPLRVFQRAAANVIFVLGWLFLIQALLPDHIFQQYRPQIFDRLEASYAKPSWFTFSEETLQLAKKEGRPVILDFKADWCVSCKQLEIYTFSQDPVLELGEQFLWLEFDATRPSPELEKLREAYGVMGLPTILFFDPSGEWRQDLTLTGFEDADQFLERMKSALN